MHQCACLQRLQRQLQSNYNTHVLEETQIALTEQGIAALFDTYDVKTSFSDIDGNFEALLSSL